MIGCRPILDLSHIMGRDIRLQLDRTTTVCSTMSGIPWHEHSWTALLTVEATTAIPTATLFI